MSSYTNNETTMNTNEQDFTLTTCAKMQRLLRLENLAKQSLQVTRKLGNTDLPADKRSRLEARQDNLEQRIAKVTANATKAKQKNEARPGQEGGGLGKNLGGMEQKLAVLKTTASNPADKRGRLEARQAHLEQRIATVTANASKLEQGDEARPGQEGGGHGENLGGMEQKLAVLKITASNVAAKRANEKLPADKRGRLEARQAHLEQRIATMTANASKPEQRDEARLGQEG